MSNWSKSVIYGGIYAKAQSETSYSGDGQKVAQKYRKIADRLEKSKKLSLFIKNNLKSHISEKQELYWPVLIAITLLLFVLASKIAFAETPGTPNPPASLREASPTKSFWRALRAGNLPINDNSKVNPIGFQKTEPVKMSLAGAQVALQNAKNTDNAEGLKEDVAKIVKNTPMAAMVDPIAERDRTVAAFIVGIAMKESKFGVYAPHVGGRDCYNYWGLKAGGKTTAGGYSCFASPEDAVSAVGKTVEKMVAKGVRTPAQAISWKCGSSCAGHGDKNVRKWIADVGVNFYKLNS